MNTRLQQSLLTLSLAAVMLGCGTGSETDPLLPEIVSIEIDEANVTTRIHSLTLDTDETQLFVTVTYDDGTSSSATYQPDWESNDTTTVDVFNGLIDAKKNNGSAEISASFRGELFTPQSKTVEIIPLRDLNVSSQDLNITYDDTNASRAALDINVTGTYPLQANGTFEDNATISAISSNIIWTSSNTSVATVDATGQLTVLAAGLTDINTSVYSEINSTLELNVTIP